MKKWDRIVMIIIIIILIWIIWILLLSKWESEISNNDVFEKKKMCIEMRNSYEKYIKDLWTIEGLEQSVGEVEMFYNLERDTCLWAFWVSSNIAWYTIRFVISDYMNWNEEIFECIARNNTFFECEEKWKQKKIELWK